MKHWGMLASMATAVAGSFGGRPGGAPVHNIVSAAAEGVLLASRMPGASRKEQLRIAGDLAEVGLAASSERFRRPAVRAALERHQEAVMDLYDALCEPVADQGASGRGPQRE